MKIRYNDYFKQIVKIEKEKVMVIIAGCIIEKDNKILMVKESKKECYGKWNIPAGHVEEGELITAGAIREIYEETGYKVKLTGTLPILCATFEGKETRIMVRFTADVIEESNGYDTNEILDVQWIDMNDIKNMTEEELRGYDINMQTIKDFEAKNIYPMDIFNNTMYLR